MEQAQLSHVIKNKNIGWRGNWEQKTKKDIDHKFFGPEQLMLLLIKRTAVIFNEDERKTKGAKRQIRNAYFIWKTTNLRADIMVAVWRVKGSKNQLASVGELSSTVENEAVFTVGDGKDMALKQK